jgi:hypothetical protein
VKLKGGRRRDDKQKQRKENSTGVIAKCARATSLHVYIFINESTSNEQNRKE